MLYEFAITNYNDSSNYVRYEGVVFLSIPYLMGTLYLKNGDIYKGQISLGRVTGFGKYTFAPDQGQRGEFYEGNFKDGVRHGNGTHVWKNGHVYVGNFESGSSTATGTHLFSNGDMYIGGLRGNQFDGYGVFTLKNGTRISGVWKDDQLLGFKGNQLHPEIGDYMKPPVRMGWL